MKKRSKSDEMTVMDAVDNLSSIAEIDVESNEEGLDRGVKENLQKFKKLKQQEKEETVQTVKGTFKTIHRYLEHVYKKDKKSLQDVEMQRGIKAIMVLAGEAANKLGRCTSLFRHTHRGEKVQGIEEYHDLREFYFNKIIKRFQEVLASEEAWEEEWGVEDQIISIERLGLKDLETVKRDRGYELFYIRKDDGSPFFNRNLLRHIKLVSDFDELITATEGEDPLLRVNVLIDKEAQAVASEIREDTKEALADFYFDALQHLNIPIIRLMNKATMSLLLASNPHNLLQHSTSKTCSRYFHDFQFFLREVLISDDYIRLISNSLNETDRLSKALVYLAHAYCFEFFVHIGKRSDLINYIHDLIKKGYGNQKIARGEVSDPLTFWNDLLDIHDAVSDVLKRCPSGPLFKTLDIFRERDDKEGFDPIYQGNQPACQFTFLSQSFKSMCLRLPCPTLHGQINKAKIIDEFKGYLRYLDQKKEIGTHLLFNLQDRTSWEEHARCQALEELSRRAEYTKQLILVTLPKRTDFYFQTDVYKEIDQAEDFLRLIKEQVASNEECGFFFSKRIPRKEVSDFVKKIVPLIHKRIFQSKKSMSRRERLDFIEIFYQFLMLKILDLVKPTYFSFTCKDAIDVGPTTSAGFYSILKMMSTNPTYSKKEQDHFLWMLYAPSLIVRERLVDYQRLSRVMSAMTALNESFLKNQKGFLKELEKLFDYPFLKKIQIQTN